jgi:hypothetical protein
MLLLTDVSKKGAPYLFKCDAPVMFFAAKRAAASTSTVRTVGAAPQHIQPSLNILNARIEH